MAKLDTDEQKEKRIAQNVAEKRSKFVFIIIYGFLRFGKRLKIRTFNASYANLSL
ncbi:hypothetical protein [Vibrio jasicida]|uniref:hypothetical protein n=1 Tax=Vibrio jasicida TaxID=766224 RepID=UPI000A5464F6|nr:hypothetical protein [Vibrio jasicida]